MTLMSSLTTSSDGQLGFDFDGITNLLFLFPGQSCAYLGRTKGTMELSFEYANFPMYKTEQHSMFSNPGHLDEIG